MNLMTQNNYSKKSPYQAIIRIIPVNSHAEGKLNEIFREGFYLRTYISPLGLLRGSPISISFGKHPSEAALNNQLVVLNEDMEISFNSRFDRKSFMNNIYNALDRLIVKERKMRINHFQKSKQIDSSEGKKLAYYIKSKLNID